MAKLSFVSPVGIAKYPHLIEPDTNGKFATGKYVTKLILTPEEAKPFIATLKAAQAKHDMGADAKLPYSPETMKDGENKKKTGNIQFSFSSKFPPILIDPKNKTVKVNKLNEDFSVGGGSKLKVAGEMYFYDKGISLQMHQVQILELVNTRPSMFDAAEGTFDQSEFEDTGDDSADVGEDSSDLGI